MDAAEERHFREFVETRSVALMRLAYLLAGGDQHAAEDLLQAALTKTAARWKSVDNPEPYVRRTMYRQQISTSRVTRRRRETQAAVLPDGAGPDATSAVDLKLTVRNALARRSRPSEHGEKVTVLPIQQALAWADDGRLFALGCNVAKCRGKGEFRNRLLLVTLTGKITPLTGYQRSDKAGAWTPVFTHR
ncbi:SigE family RNA polymerase sigma factor [Actinomadura monticuli]|uniref:SigE family RNA polymerase sigma factor n=1 Tax=Actinomadura monticuli TaxID=3097367 RepID=A0ABV4QFQ1_9ACTN